MLTDRGVDMNGINESFISDIVLKNATKTSFEVKMDNIYVIYYIPSKFRMGELKKLLDDNEDRKLNKDVQFIIVLNDKMSLINLRTLNSMPNLQYQIFRIKELQFNITKHILVPKHEVVRDEEVIKSILDSYSLKTKYQLPTILKTDPMSRYLGLKSGDIVKITRNSPSSGEYIVYRCCM